MALELINVINQIQEPLGATAFNKAKF